MVNYTLMLSQAQLIQASLLKRSRWFSFVRLLSFVLFLASAIAAFTLASWWWWMAVALLVTFAVLVISHEQLSRKQKYNDARILAISHEIEAINGNYSSFDGGGEFNDPAHLFSTDLDIFGDHSVFQAINRTATLAGKQLLASWLSKPLLDKDSIYARQQAVKELMDLPEWRIDLRAHGMVIGEEKRDLDKLNEWLVAKPLFKSGIFKIAGIIIPLASFSVTAMLITNFITVQLFLLYLIVPLAFAGYFTKRINHRHAMLSKKVDLLSKYASRFRMIENTGFSSAFMTGLQDQLKSGHQLASTEINRLSRITASLDTRLNLLAGFMLNIYLLWDIRQMRRLEHWQARHHENLPRWFEALSKVEAISSLGAFAAASPSFVFPEISTDDFSIEAGHAGHPLIPSLGRVDNTIEIAGEGRFNIITGANMAGKSTYLRTIGVNMVLALTGAPVCAKSFSCYPAPVFTSLRTTDSLSSNTSYFYAELLRLKALIDRLNAGEKLFILLDEILKGTNSADKQAGSKALLTQLIGLNASGFIATHDLELGSLATTFPERVRNFHFESEIKGDELFFDYKLKPGIAQNMNATFLMQRMGITIGE